MMPLHIEATLLFTFFICLLTCLTFVYTQPAVQPKRFLSHDSQVITGFTAALWNPDFLVLTESSYDIQFILGNFF